MELMPFAGFNEVRFGMTRPDVRKVFAEQPIVFKKNIFAANLTDAYNEHGMHLYYDERDRLIHIEMFAPASPTLVGVKLLDRRPIEVLADLEQLGYSAKIAGDSYDLVNTGISLYAPGREEERDYVDAVSLWSTDPTRGKAP